MLFFGHRDPEVFRAHALKLDDRQVADIATVLAAVDSMVTTTGLYASVDREYTNHLKYFGDPKLAWQNCHHAYLLMLQGLRLIGPHFMTTMKLWKKEKTPTDFIYPISLMAGASLHYLSETILQDFLPDFQEHSMVSPPPPSLRAAATAVSQGFLWVREMLQAHDVPFRAVVSDKING